MFVPAVHFSLYSGFYAAPIVGERMFLLAGARWFFYICVPLFMIATGFLQYKKGLSKKFYLSLLPLLASYVFIAVACFLFRKYLLEEKLDYLDGILGVANFSADPYSWYAEMFIGLYLLIPFINMGYNALETKRRKTALIGILLFLSSGTSLLSSFSVSGRYLDISTNWWTGLYPITYYLIGAYICEYQVKMDRNQKLAYTLVILLVISAESILARDKGLIFDKKFNGYNCIYTVIVAILFFVMVYRVNFNSKIIRSAVTSISKRSWDIFLFSYIFDKFYYPILVKLFYHNTPQFGVVAFLSVPLVFVSSLAASYTMELLFKAVKGILSKPNINRGQEAAVGGS